MAGVDDKEQFFEELAAANRRRIMAIARAYAPARDRQDLYQEILLQVWKSLGAFQGRSAPSTWIYRVALNTAITFRRRNAKSETQTMPLLDPERRGARSYPGDEVLVLEDFLHSLGKIDRAVLLLYLEDLSYHDISEVTGLTENHVGVRISRLKKAFAGRYCLR